jgi:hypothetical protein
MKDSEFLELLNLYLDHEITAADAVRLEAEIRHNAERRKIYREYCRMQQACRILAADVTGVSSEIGSKAKVVAFGDRGSRRNRMSAY